MTVLDEALRSLTRIPNLQVTRNEPLSAHTRFGLGGPAALFATTDNRDAFLAALQNVREGSLPWTVIGDGTNLILSDEGFPGCILRFTAKAIHAGGATVRVESGAALQDLVDFTIAHGLRGLETMTGIPGSVGAAVYGNAGAYGRSIHESLTRVEFFDGNEVRWLDNAACEFRYRESLFKRRKDWFILSAELNLVTAPSSELAATAAGILEIRNKKYPPTMRCAGSFFKNCLWDELPESARQAVPAGMVREGKVPSAFFLEQVGAKGRRHGGIQIAEYHANTPFNDGTGTARQVVELIIDLKRRVRERFGFDLEEEVQYIGFPDRLPGLPHIRSTPAALATLTAGLSESELRWQPSPGRWSIANVLAHLAEAEEKCFYLRARQMLQEIDPQVTPYDPSTLDIPPAESLEKLRVLRHEAVVFLDTLQPQAAVLVSHHPELGTITLSELLNEWAFHDLGHLRQITELIRALKYYPHLGPFQPLYKVNP